MTAGKGDRSRVSSLAVYGERFDAIRFGGGMDSDDAPAFDQYAVEVGNALADVLEQVEDEVVAGDALLVCGMVLGGKVGDVLKDAGGRLLGE